MDNILMVEECWLLLFPSVVSAAHQIHKLDEWRQQQPEERGDADIVGVGTSNDKRVEGASQGLVCSNTVDVTGDVTDAIANVDGDVNGDVDWEDNDSDDSDCLPNVPIFASAVSSRNYRLVRMMLSMCMHIDGMLISRRLMMVMLLCCFLVHRR